MKIKYCSLFLLFFLAAQVTIAQSNERIVLPILKETKKIDDLMNLLSGPEIASDRTEKSFSTDSCWIIELIDVKIYIALQITKNRKTDINTIINGINTKKGSYGFFKYRGHEILVWDWNTDSFYSLFGKTGEEGTIDFIYKIKNDGIARSKDGSDGSIFQYTYQNDRISVAGGPPPVLVK